MYELAKNFFLEGIRYHELGQLENAKSSYVSALSLAPGRHSILNNLSAVLFDLGEDEECQAVSGQLLRVIDNDAERLPVLLRLVSSYQRSGQRVQATEEITAVAQCLLRLAFPVGESIALQGKAQDLDRELTFPGLPSELLPYETMYLFFLGSLNYDLSNFKLAIRAFQLVLEREPTNRTARIRLGNCYLGLCDYLKALETYQEVVKLAIDDADVRFNIGNAFMHLGNLDEAELAYQEALLLNHDHRDARLNYGRMLLKAGRHKEALKQIRTGQGLIRFDRLTGMHLLLASECVDLNL